MNKLKNVDNLKAIKNKILKFKTSKAYAKGFKQVRIRREHGREEHF